MADQILLGVALIILINPHLAVLAAILVVACFIYKFGKAVIKDQD